MIAETELLHGGPRRWTPWRRQGPHHPLHRPLLRRGRNLHRRARSLRRFTATAPTWSPSTTGPSPSKPIPPIIPKPNTFAAPSTTLIPTKSISAANSTSFSPRPNAPTIPSRAAACPSTTNPAAPLGMPSNGSIKNAPKFSSSRTSANFAIGVRSTPMANARSIQKRPDLQSLARRLRALGYKVEYRVLCAADYGDPTTRRRLFVIGTRGRRPVPWPEPTHTKDPNGGLFTLKPWVPARDIINWELPGKSIYNAKNHSPPKPSAASSSASKNTAASLSSFPTRAKTATAPSPPINRCPPSPPPVPISAWPIPNKPRTLHRSTKQQQQTAQRSKTSPNRHHHLARHGPGRTQTRTFHHPTTCRRPPRPSNQIPLQPSPPPAPTPSPSQN
jgi:hypothetical protein